MPVALPLFALASLVFSGAIFGFFYAWICSTMWGLNAADPSIAIAAMQAMNASVRNAVFAPAFFGTPLVLAVTALLAWTGGKRIAAGAFFTGAVIYLLGGLGLTMAINVPMNEALAAVRLPLPAGEAAQVWQDYSGTWQVWNTARTLFSGLALVCAGVGVLTLNGRG